MSDHFGEAIDKINRIGRMQPGWNGQGATVAKAELRDTVISFLRKLRYHTGTSVPEPTLVAPTSDGGVSLEWRLREPEKTVIEFVFLPDGLHEIAHRDVMGHVLDVRDDVSEEQLLQSAKVLLVGRSTVQS